MSTLVIHGAYVYPPECSDADLAAIAEALRQGVCPCGSEAEDPGPNHLPTCRFADDDYGGF